MNRRIMFVIGGAILLYTVIMLGAFFATAPIAWGQVTAQRQQAAFAGVFAGGPVNYTMDVPTPLGWQNNRGFRVCGAFPTAGINTGSASLSVEKKTALPIFIQRATPAGTPEELPLVGGELIGTQCLVVNNTQDGFVFEGLVGGIVPGLATHTVTKAEWNFGRHYVYDANGALVLPDAGTIANQSGIIVQTLKDATVELTTAVPADGINGTLGGAVEILPNTTTIITTTGGSGGLAFRVPTPSEGGGTEQITTNCAESAAFLTRALAVGWLNTAHQQAYDALICGLVIDGTPSVWSKLDALWITGTQNKAVALLNLKSSNYTLVMVGAPNWEADKGFSGPADSPPTTTVYIDTGLNPATSSTIATANSTHLMGWSHSNWQSVGYAALLGAGDGTHATEIHPHTTNAGDLFGVNNDVNLNMPQTVEFGTPPTAAGSFIANRTSASSVTLYREGVAMPLNIGNEAFFGVPNNDLYLIATSNASGATQGTNRILAAASYGAGLTSQDINGGAGAGLATTGLEGRVRVFLLRFFTP